MGEGSSFQRRSPLLEIRESDVSPTPSLTAHSGFNMASAASEPSNIKPECISLAAALRSAQ